MRKIRKILFSLYTSPGDDLVLVVYLSGLSGLYGLYGLYGFNGFNRFYGFYGFSRPADISNNLVKAFIVVGYK